MAQRTIIELLDDLDGRKADETVAFSIDGVTYEIDLSKKNAEKLRKEVEPFIASARKASSRQSRRSTRGARSGNSRERSADVRAWAKERGITVNDRGRIPANVVEQYEAAH